jgi:hypothetical protein
MMAGCVGADMQGVCNRGVCPALSEQRGNFQLSPGKAVSLLQIRQPALSHAVGARSATLFLKLSAQLPHLAHRFAQLLEQLPAVSLEIRECGKKIV